MKINIKDLFSKLNTKEYEDINIENNLEYKANLDNIKKRVINNVNENRIIKSSSIKNKNRGFKRPFRNMWLAALIICITATTVFAYSNVEFFKRIFGKDVEITEENIQNVLATTENESLIFSVESLLSDGNQNYFIISLQMKNGEEIGEISPIMIGLKADKPSDKMSIGLRSIKKIDSLSTSPNKTYYLFKENTNTNLIGKSVEMSFARNEDEKMVVSFDIEDNNNLKELEMEEFQILDNKYAITEIKYSNLGMNIEGKIMGGADTIPTIKIKLKYKDGLIKEVSTKLEDNDRFGFMYQRHGEEFTNTVIFKEIIDFDLVESIIIEGKEFNID